MRISLLSLALVGACYQPTPLVPERPEVPPRIQDQHWNQSGSPRDLGAVAVHPNDVVYGKITRRLRVEQLRRIIPQLFEGITWVDPEGNNQFDELIATLGEADYVERMADETVASPLFAKFMDDMAGSVCGQAMARDARNGEPSSRILTPYASDVYRNLRFLRLKFHGIHVPEESTESLLELKQLYESIRGERGPQTGWFGICVAMVTAPEFISY